MYHLVDFYFSYWIFLVNFFFGDEDFFFIGVPSLLFFDEGLEDFDLLDVFLVDAMIG